MSGVLQQFVRTFFDENPLSQVRASGHAFPGSLDWKTKPLQLVVVVLHSFAGSAG